MITYIVIGVVFWIVCCLYSIGVTVAYFQNEFAVLEGAEYRSDLAFAIAFSIVGPYSAIVVTFLSGFLKHGWQLGPYKGTRA